MKKLLGLIFIIILLTGCNTSDSNLNFDSSQVKPMEIGLAIMGAQGVNNGRVSQNVVSGMTYASLYHHRYLQNIDELDGGWIDTDESKEVVLKSANMLSEGIMDIDSPFSITDADKEIVTELYQYMTALLKESDNIERYIKHGDELNLKQAKEYHAKALKQAKKLDKFVEKYELNYGAK